MPTLAEAGYPGLEMTTWYGVFAPAGTPKEVVAKLHDEIMNALKLPDVQKRIAGLAGEPGTMTIDAVRRAQSRRLRALRQADPRREHPWNSARRP